jgi:hypothetical protein
VLECLANGEIDGRILATNLDMIYHWLIDGSLPPAPERAKRAPALKTV